MTKNKLKKLLDERGISRNQFAIQTGISKRIIYELAAADKIPDKTYVGTLKKIRDALGLNCIDDLEEEEKS